MDDAIADVAEKPIDRFVLAVLGAVGGDLHGEDVVGGEARRDGLQADETADEEPGADQQHQREREFGNHQQAAQAVARQTQTAVALTAAAGGFERRVQVHFDGAPGGGDAEEKAGDEGDAEGEGQNGAVDGDVLQPRNVAGIDGAHHVEGPLGDEEAGGAAHDGEQKAFGQQLADDAQAARAQRGADGDFLFAGGGAREQQVGDVGAGDQQNQRDRAEQDQ